MNELLNKLTSYNIFNYLLPGTVFVVLAEFTTKYELAQNNIILAAFFYYFIGLVISRLGSLLIEPLFKSVGFIKFSSYSDYIAASEKDEKLPTLSEANNMYRTFFSLFCALLLLKLYEYFSTKYSILMEWTSELTIIALLILFGFSYKKQTKYITERIKHHLKQGAE